MKLFKAFFVPLLAKRELFTLQLHCIKKPMKNRETYTSGKVAAYSLIFLTPRLPNSYI